MSLFKRFKSKKGNKTPATASVATTSPPPSSAANAGGRSGIRTTLQNLSTVLEIGKSIGEATQILSPMKTVCGVLQTLVDIALRVQANGENLQDLVGKLERQLESIKKQLTVLDGPDFREAKLGNQDLVELFENYVADLEKLDVKLNALGEEYIGGQKKVPKKVIIVKAVEEGISDLTRKLDDSFQLFMNSINSFVAGQTLLIRNELADLRERFALSQLPLADARGNMHDPCLEGTRVDLLERMSHWATDDTVPPVLALIDLAGTGKSTIATHMAKQWEKNKTSAAQFFFSKPTTVTGKNFASTVARDITQSIPHLRPIILSALKEHADIAARSIQEQLEWIVFNPLRSTTQTHIMVIDALDECSSSDRGIILDSILKFLNEYPAGRTPVKVFLTCRPEVDIMNRINSPTYKNLIARLDFSLRPEPSQHNLDDIRLYIETYLGDRLVPDEIDKFVSRTGGLFIWASTAMQFLSQAKNFKARFRMLMSSESKESPLDYLYSQVLEDVVAGCVGEEKEELEKVLKVVCVAKDPLTAASMDELLKLDTGVAQSIISSLSSVLSDGSQNQPVCILHPTFLEHLQNPSRPGPIFVPNEEAEGLVAGGCLSSLCNGLKYNICSVLRPRSAAPKNEQVEDLRQLLEERTTPTLRYVAIHALSHVAPCLGDKEIVGKLHDFFESKLLNWIELVSFLGKVYYAIQVLHHLKCSIDDILEPASKTMLFDVREWCDETLKLIQPFQAVIEASAMQIYFSALPFFPPDSRISRYYLPYLQQSIPKVLYQRTSPSRSKLLVGHQSCVISIIISPDGQHVTSFEALGKRRRWDVATGGCVAELNIDIWPYNSPNAVMQPLADEIFATVFHGGMIALRNMRTAAVLWEVQCAIDAEWPEVQASAKACAEFSPDGTFLASYYGSMMQIWDIETGKEIWRKKVEDGMRYIALSPDSKLLANVDGHWVVRVWNIATGKCVVLPTTTPIPWNLNNFCLAFSSDGTTLAGLLPNATIRLWYLKDGGAVHHQDIANSEGSSIFTFSPFSQLLAYVSENTMRLYDVVGNKDVGEPLTGHTSKITCLAFSSNGRTLASGSQDHTVRIWELTSTETVGQPPRQLELDLLVTNLTTPFNNRHLASNDAGEQMHLWDEEAGKDNWWLNGDNTVITDLLFSPDGCSLALGYLNGDVKFWDVASRKVIGSVVGRGSQAKSCVFSPDSKFVAIEEDCQVVVVYEVPSGKMVAERHPGVDWIISKSFHLHQGNYFLLINEERIWDISADLIFDSNSKNVPFNLDDLDPDTATYERPWVFINKSFICALPPHVYCYRFDYKRGKFACGGLNGIELIVDCSHLI